MTKTMTKMESKEKTESGTALDRLLLPSKKGKIVTPQMKAREAVERKRFFLDKSETLENIRGELQKKLEAHWPKKEKKNKDGSIQTLGDYCYIKELTPGRAVVEKGNELYGVVWARDKGTGGVNLTSVVPVEQQYVEKAGTEKQAD